jgi:hypothetical protein
MLAYYGKPLSMLATLDLRILPPSVNRKIAKLLLL